MSGGKLTEQTKNKKNVRENGKTLLSLKFHERTRRDGKIEESIVGKCDNLFGKSVHYT